MDHLETGLLLGVAAALLTGAGFSLGRRTAPDRTVRAPPSATSNPPIDALPGHLAVETRTPFFSLGEGAFFRTLERALPPGYRAFPNVRLYDLFLIVAALPPQQAALASLRDEHIDFLIVVLDGHHPVAAIELTGKTVHHAEQRRRDEAKDLAFRSAGLLLLRLRAEEDHTQTSLEALLWQHLRPAQRDWAEQSVG
ncbi:DUF2726 domain-containing protein [Deinococcus marmoris]|uniref:DUF2726 domain-containing protein n=1 Tax=Deinococcus marmoris TaxID=249408 RepID=A0A1U7P3J1_9DEIO|nr:DUF2726 domain-containing protein [Deinococcus marmoris]OLV19729.1 hypothetical protein BOO71_0001552 [Deinococcus marmoris]